MPDKLRRHLNTVAHHSRKHLFPCRPSSASRPNVPIVAVASRSRFTSLPHTGQCLGPRTLSDSAMLWLGMPRQKGISADNTRSDGTCQQNRTQDGYEWVYQPIQLGRLNSFPAIICTQHVFVQNCRAATDATYMLHCNQVMIAVLRGVQVRLVCRRFK